MNIEEAKKVLEENGYLLETAWTIDDIKDRVRDMYEDTFHTTFTDKDYTNVASRLIKTMDWNDGISWSTIDDVVEDYAFDSMLSSISNDNVAI